eukprot:CAMPEP_0176005156 /NCGR_PEP_ID=MMETSP0120_2-20121206/2061_1 /TAXON_ID=160619 /ORGANISM="Kryptoperidinium foliaceum, Strain CCMP 1326" /LENGTH=75 /DNA_ID=CAMNT_0017337855 /DNA_START=204 /DNA_END=428 /DNA_ORIENTATION=+
MVGEDKTKDQAPVKQLSSDSDDLKQKTTPGAPESSSEEYPMRFLAVRFPNFFFGKGGGEIYMNWFTSFFGFAFLW